MQLPTELPLGLVFVVGRVGLLEEAKNGRAPQVQFTLVEETYQVYCVLSPRAASEVALQHGMTIRAGGHLAFDPQRAGYYLFVRDVEIVHVPLADEPAPPPLVELPPEDRTAVEAILADIKKRSDAANLAQADLPVWVQKIAPPEVQAEIEEDVEPSVRVNPPSLKTPSSGVESLDAGLLARLSAAMDSDEELELTPEMLVEYADQLEEPPIVPDTRPYDVPPPAELLAETAVPRPAVGLEDPEAVKPLARHNTDFWMVLLILAFIVVAVVLVVAIITML
ncbi:MAG: hypothetical protein H6659_10370 [Ardenticatenaceae bacterium]|nr:hypothetical protein [Ardenticatenaceae bacterium]